MQPLIIALLASLSVYAVIHILVARLVGETENTAHLRESLKQLRDEASAALLSEEHLTRSIMRQHVGRLGPIARIFFRLPGTHTLYPVFAKAGMKEGGDTFFLIVAVVFCFALFVLRGMGLFAVLCAAVAAFAFGYLYLQRKIRKRRAAMIGALPDVLEMIVRSVRAGYPLNSVVRIVSENMQPPISEEFKQVADEMAHGSSLIDALRRMAKRVDEPDILFFVVVLSVQQEVGGNLAEVLSNLARLIRRRKNLRLKILALSSEGRASMWVLGSLPVFVGGIINFMTPGHMKPFFETSSGHMLFAVAIGMVLTGVLIVKKIVNIKV